MLRLLSIMSRYALVKIFNSMLSLFRHLLTNSVLFLRFHKHVNLPNYIIKLNFSRSLVQFSYMHKSISYRTSFALLF
jgi:hypothetical protein